MIIVRIALCLVLFATPPGEAEQASRLRAVPWYGMLSDLPLEDRPVAHQLLTIDENALDALISSDDPIDRGLAIFVLSHRGEVGRLLELSDWLDDHRPSVDMVQGGAGVRQYFYHEMTLSAHLATVYGLWFGVSVASSSEQCRQVFDRVDDPDHCVGPWLHRLRLAKYRYGGDLDPHAPGWLNQTPRLDMRTVMRDVRELPPEIRWVVTALGVENVLLSVDDARDILLALPEPLKANLAGRRVDPDTIADPTLNQHGARQLHRALDQYERLTRDQ